jgi:hypothetical protein
LLQDICSTVLMPVSSLLLPSHRTSYGSAMLLLQDLAGRPSVPCRHEGMGRETNAMSCEAHGVPLRVKGVSAPCAPPRRKEYGLIFLCGPFGFGDSVCHVWMWFSNTQVRKACQSGPRARSLSRWSR